MSRIGATVHRALPWARSFAAEGLLFHFILNAYWEPLEFELPRVGEGSSWRRWIDTALDSPHDIVPWQTAPTVSGSSYRVEARSVVFLYAVARSAVSLST